MKLSGNKNKETNNFLSERTCVRKREKIMKLTKLLMTISEHCEA